MICSKLIPRLAYLLHASKCKSWDLLYSFRYQLLKSHGTCRALAAVKIVSPPKSFLAGCNASELSSGSQKLALSDTQQSEPYARNASDYDTGLTG